MPIPMPAPIHLYSAVGSELVCESCGLKRVWLVTSKEERSRGMLPVYLKYVDADGVMYDSEPLCKGVPKGRRKFSCSAVARSRRRKGR